MNKFFQKLKKIKVHYLLIFIFLFLSVWLFILERSDLSPQEIFLVIIWAFLGAEILYNFFPQILKNKKYWRIYATVVLVLSVIWSLLARSAGQKTIPLLLLSFFCLLWTIAFRYLSSLKQGDDKPKGEWRLFWLIALGDVILWGARLRFAAIDPFSLQGDEYFHANTAQGYLATGQYVQWNYLTQEPQWHKLYERAQVYTWQVAQSIKLFGAAEWAIRLPALLWGVLFLLAVSLLTYFWTRSLALSFFITALAGFDPTLIWLSVFSRMYSMLFVTTLAAVFLFYQAVSKPHDQAKSRVKRWLFFSLAVLLGLFNLLVHELSFLFLGALFLYILVAWFLYKENAWYKQAGLAFIICFFIGIVGQIFHPFFHFSFITWRTQPNDAYLLYPFQSWVLPFLGILFFVFGILRKRLKKLNTAVMLSIIMSVPALLYFTYSADRYPAKKYFAF